MSIQCVQETYKECMPKKQGGNFGQETCRPYQSVPEFCQGTLVHIVSSEGHVKPAIERAIPGLQGGSFNNCASKASCEPLEPLAFYDR